MAEVLGKSFDPESTVVVLKYPLNVGEDELKAHFQAAKHDGGDVDQVLIHENVAFVTFDMPEVARSILRPEKIINGCKLKVESYNSWTANKKKQDSLVLKDSEPEDTGNATVYVSGLKESTTGDTVTLFFENKKRSGGGELCEGKEGYKRISNTVARLTFVSAKVAQMVLKKASETPLCLEGNLLKVSTVFEPTHDRVTLIGTSKNVTHKKQQVETMIDKLTEAAQKKSTEFLIEDKNKLKFLQFIDYFKNLMIEFPVVQIRGTDSKSGKLMLLGTTGEIKDVQLGILQDLVKISEFEVKMSFLQKEFLQRTSCQIVNNELKKDDVMLMLVTTEETVGGKDLQAKIFSLTKCDDNKRRRLVDIVLAKTSEKLKQVDVETADFLAKSEKLQKFKKEQFDKNQVLVNQELINPHKIYIVCEESKMNNAEQGLKILIDEMKIRKSTFEPPDLMKVRFLKWHCWNKITEKEKSLKAEAVAVICNHNNSLQVKGTRKGREEMITFLDDLAKKVSSKAYKMTEHGVRKQMTMEATDDIISKIEKDYCCVIKKDIQPGKTPDMTKEAVDNSTVKVDGTAGPSGKSSMNLPYNSMSFVNDKEVKIAFGGKITIVVGDLAHQQVDAIVNTTNANLNLNGSACGIALLKVAGKQLSDECQKIGRLKVGNIATTGSANLNCKRVYHVCSSSWDGGKGALILRQLIKMCLQQARMDKFTSIAIPAIGTGNLHFPRQEVAKIFFEEATSDLTAHPESAMNDVRFVVYGGDQATVDAFLAAVLEIKSMILPRLNRSVSVTTSRNIDTGNRTNYNIPLTEKPDGTLELSPGSTGVTVQIICDDITNETTDLIMHVITQDFSIQGGVAKALVRVGGTSIFQECRNLGKPALFTTQYTKAGNLAVNQIAHVIAPSSTKVADLQKCVGAFFDDVSTKNIASISLSAVGAGRMGYSEAQSADLVFDNLSRISKNESSSLKLVRIVILEKPRFLRFKDATKAYFASLGATSSNPQPSNSSPSLMTIFRKMFHSVRLKITGLIERDGVSIEIYSNNRGKIDKAWEELKKKINENIKEITISDDVFKKFTDRDLEKLRKLERDFDFEIKLDQEKGVVKFKGHIVDIANVQGKISEILNDIKEEDKITDFWDDMPDNRKFYLVNLPISHKEYNEVETAFRKTARNKIVRIERVQNKEIHELFNVKRQAMMKKYGSNFTGKELMLFHGTSVGNIEKINACGLNRSYAGMHATAYGRGVYFARDASYSCSSTYSPPDPQGLRYMYYAKVLVGEYTKGNSSMIVPPKRNSTDPYETYESVVDDPANPSIYVLFQDYEYYTKYLISFK